MTQTAILVLSLVVSVAAAAIALVLIGKVERFVSEPGLRDSVWGMALYLCGLPPVIVALLLALPARVEMVAADGLQSGQIQLSAAVVSGNAQSLASILASYGPELVLALAGCACGFRLWAVGVRLMRLRRLVRASGAAPSDLIDVVDRVAQRMDIATPEVRTGPTGSTPFVAGLGEPMLILPEDLVVAGDTSVLRAICTHELAHLRRGDHWTFWLEEILLTVLAINPLLSRMRDHRAAAREEACDQEALAQADAGERHRYARHLLAALKSPAIVEPFPALTFTSQRRIFAMRRLKTILSPDARRTRRPRLVLAGLAVVLGGVGSAGSLAVAAQRQPVLVQLPERAATPLSRPTPAAIPVATATPPRAPTPLAATTGAPRVPMQQTPAAPTYRPSIITNPGWSLNPSAEYPAEAMASGVEGGRVTLSCTAESDGRLAACSVVEETPTGNGFGAAALKAAQTARLSPRTIDGAAAGAQVRFTISFRLG